MQHKTAIVVGAGIAGLATARSLAERGYQVTVFERSQKAVGASIRNFGMIWPIGQPAGRLYETALRSKSIWKKVCTDAGLWFEEKGSLHLAYNDLEWQVINDFAAANNTIRPVAVLNAAQSLAKSGAVNPENLKGALFSSDEMIVEARDVIEKLPAYLHTRYGIQFHFSKAITAIDHPYVFSGNERYEADKIFVCSGADFETLYPELFTTSDFTKCKLQMMRLDASSSQERIGPSLCGGLSLIHYKSFQEAASLSQLKDFYHSTMHEYLERGIHVMVSQNAQGELTVGDSHEYALTHDPFDRQHIYQLILDYLHQFALLKNRPVLQTWNGIYTKMLNGNNEYIHQPEPGVIIFNGLGGSGMTMSFGLAEEVVDRFG